MVNNSTGIRFDSVNFNNPIPASVNPNDPSVDVWGSKNISFSGVKMHGSLDGNPANDGYGLYARHRSGISVTNEEFTQIGRGAVFNAALGRGQGGERGGQ